MTDPAEKNKSGQAAEMTERIKRLSLQVRKTATRVLPHWAYGIKEPKWQRWTLIVATSLVIAFLIAPKSPRYYSITVGEPATETIISPVTFKVIDEEATNKNRDEVLKSVRPVYDFDDEMIHDVQARITSAFNFMKDYLAKEMSYRSREADESKAPKDQQEQTAAEEKAFRPLDPETLRTRFDNLLGTKVSPSDFALLKGRAFDDRIQRDISSLVVPVFLQGVVLSRDLLMRDGKQGILLRTKTKDKLEPLKDPTSIYDLKEAIAFINEPQNDPAPGTAYSRAIRQLATDLINVNITYNREESARLKDKALASVKPVYFQVAKGESIIREGEPVNKGHQIKLAGLAKSNPPYSRLMILAGLALVLILLLRLSFYFSERYLERSRHATEDLLLFCILLVGTVVMVRFISSLAPLTATVGQGVDAKSILFAAPVATGPMLAALMVDARIAFIFAALISLGSVLAVEGDVYLFIFYFVSGIVGLHGMTRITDRTSVLRAGFLVAVVNAISVLAIKMALGDLTTLVDLYEVGLGFLGGVICGLLVSGLAPLLEPLGYITNVRLLELANLNHPLLKEMAIAAPGTYHHSMMVGNLAETAAELIGANPLLARVGALYHDIGKAGKKTKPYYFIENQQGGCNPHDKLEPSMSALILVSHVKNGVEKAREYRLGAPIIDIIQQHHGTNLIKFFYNKALEKSARSNQPVSVSEDEYRYAGPRPQTKEAALVMLADVVEAACRTLADPTPARIQKRVQTLIMGLFSEGQLDQSTLTLKDLHAITKSFVRAQQGILHTRIDYPRPTEPQEKTNGDFHKQQPERHRNKSGRSTEENGTNIRRLGL
ncbi:MAG: HDIG domain-containing metalloprotein [Thermodesulfobacteriota bacterium]